MATERQPRLEVVKIEGGEVVYSMPLRATDERYVERVERGVLTRLAGRTDVFVRAVDVDDDSATKPA